MPRHNRQRGGRPGDGRWGSPRKRARDARETERTTRADRPVLPPKPPSPPVAATDFILLDLPVAPSVSVCGNCMEWYPHEEGGRGDCQHPGSGFVSPWSDTPACPFFSRARTR